MNSSYKQIMKYFLELTFTIHHKGSIHRKKSRKIFWIVSSHVDSNGYGRMAFKKHYNGIGDFESNNTFEDSDIPSSHGNRVCVM